MKGWLPPLAAAAFVAGCSPPAPSPPRACAPPRAYWHRPHNFQGLHAPTMLVGLDRHGGIYWNGERLEQRRFAAYLTAVHGLNPQPEVFLEVEAGVPCASLEAVRDSIDRYAGCRAGGRCAEGVRSIWEGLPTPPGTPPS